MSSAWRTGCGDLQSPRTIWGVMRMCSSLSWAGRSSAGKGEVGSIRGSQQIIDGGEERLIEQRVFAGCCTHRCQKCSRLRLLALSIGFWPVVGFAEDAPLVGPDQVLRQAPSVRSDRGHPGCRRGPLTPVVTTHRSSGRGTIAMLP